MGDSTVDDAFNNAFEDASLDETPIVDMVDDASAGDVDAILDAIPEYGRKESLYNGSLTFCSSSQKALADCEERKILRVRLVPPRSGKRQQVALAFITQMLNPGEFLLKKDSAASR